MYKIIKNGAAIGLAAKPVYVMLLDNGYYGLCNAAEASAVVYDGTVYQLGGEGGVLLVEVDAGTVLDEQRRPRASSPARTRRQSSCTKRPSRSGKSRRRRTTR